MEADRDYVLGTHDGELARLGLQHAVWRPRALDAWRRAGINEGQRVIDFGAGPGYAALDFADMVGPTGEVWALERSQRFLAHLAAQAAARGASSIRPIECDLDDSELPVAGADAGWCRWIFAFLQRPQEALERLCRAVRPGGALIIHEYANYETWRLAPRAAPFERFVTEVTASWRAAGGEPDVGMLIPGWLHMLGWRIESIQPIIDIVGPQDFVWRWPAAFVRTNLGRLIELGHMSRAEADEAQAALANAEASRESLMVTPLVVEIIARRSF